VVTEDYVMKHAPKAKAFWPVLLVVLLTDCSTKEYVEAELHARDMPQAVVGQVVRLNLAYNEGAAFGLSFGAHTQRVLGIVGIAVLGLVLTAYGHLEPRARWRAVGLAMIAGGALGNLWDRLWSPYGVVDFIDIGVGSLRFWTFNVADMGITCGVLILLFTWGLSGQGRPQGS
jgi:signal peptidase II